MKRKTLEFILTFFVSAIISFSLYTLYIVETLDDNVIENNSIKSSVIQQSNNKVESVSYKDEMLHDINELKKILIALSYEDKKTDKDIKEYESLISDFNPQHNIDLLALDYLDFRSQLVKKIQIQIENQEEE